MQRIAFPTIAGWIRKLLSGGGGGGTYPIIKRSNRVRLGLEILGERILPAVHVWDGGGSDSKMSTVENWSSDTMPVIGDTLLLNGTSSKNIVIDAGFLAQIASLEIASGYGGGVSVERTFGVADLTLAAGTLNADENLTVTDSFLQSGGTLGGSATVSIAAGAEFEWSGGMMTGEGISRVEEDATLAITGSAFHYLREGRTLENNGIGVWTGDGLIISGSGSGEFLNAGELDIQGDGGLSNAYGGALSFTNASTGVLTRSTSSGTASINATFDNDGEVAVESGTLAFVAGGALNGTINAVADTHVTFQGATFTVGDGAAFTGAGIYHAISGELDVDDAASFDNLSLEGGTLSGDGVLSILVNLAWSHGIMKDEGITRIDDEATLAITGSAFHYLREGRTLENNGVGVRTGDGLIISGSGGGEFLNAGELDIQGDGGFYTNYGGALAFTNASTGVLTRSTNSRTATIYATFDNDGAVAVESGTLLLIGGGADTGDFSVAADATLQFAGAHSLADTTAITGGGTREVTAGTLAVADTTITIGSLDIASGATLSGSADITSDVTNVGTLTVGSTQALGGISIDGDYTQTSTGVLNVELLEIADDNFDKLAITGEATLAGTLNVAFLEEYTVAPGDLFDFLTFDSRSSDFTTKNFPSLEGQAKLVYFSDAVALKINTPPTLVDPGDLQSARGDVVSFGLDASDADDDTLTYSATGLPPGLSINSETGVISGTISNSANTSEPYSVTVTAADAVSNDQQTFDWTIHQAYAVVLQGDQSNLAGNTVEVELSSFFVQDHTLAYSATGLPPGLSIDSETGVISGTIEYGAESSEPYEVTITITDEAGGANDEVSFDWYVDAPEVLILAYDDMESIVGVAIDLHIVGEESSEAALTYTATGLPAGLSIDSQTGLISGTIATNADLNSPYSVTVRATCEEADVYSEITFSWNVRHLVLRNPGDQQNLIDEEVSLVLAAPYAGTGTLVFSATGLPSGLSINAATGVISGTIDSDADDEEPYEVTIEATDGTLLESITFLWEVKKLIIEDIGDQFSVDGEEIQVEVDVAQLEGHTISFTASGLPDGLSIDEETGVISGMIDQDAHEEGPYEVSITATDDLTQVIVSKSITWYVDLRNAPLIGSPKTGPAVMLVSLA